MRQNCGNVRARRFCPPAPGTRDKPASTLFSSRLRSRGLKAAAQQRTIWGVPAASLAASVDRAGETLVALRGDGSGPHTVENARRRACTANTFTMSTEQFIQDMKTRPVRRDQTTLPHVIAINGGGRSRSATR